MNQGFKQHSNNNSVQGLKHSGQYSNMLGLLNSDMAIAGAVNRAELPRQHPQFSHYVATEDSLSESFELIKILRSHQHTGRWTVLIAPQNIPDKALLQCCSVDMGQVLVVHPRQTTDLLATLENALSQSTCSAVVAWADQLPKERLIELNRLAAKSNCHFYGFHRLPGWTA